MLLLSSVKKELVIFFVKCIYFTFGKEAYIFYLYLFSEVNSSYVNRVTF